MRSQELISSGNRIRKVLGIALGAGTLALGIAGCGDEGVHSKKEATKIAEDAYTQTYAKASPAGKFLLQYLRKTEISILDYNGGFWNEGENGYHEFAINNGCLQGTAYDIAGGALEAKVTTAFLFGSSSAEVSGKVPTAAAFAIRDPKNPNDLTVKSGHVDSVDLHLTGLEGGDYLIPADAQTKNVLRTYGCEPGRPITYRHESGFYAEPNTSDYVIRTSPNMRPRIYSAVDTSQ